MFDLAIIIEEITTIFQKISWRSWKWEKVRFLLNKLNPDMHKYIVRTVQTQFIPSQIAFIILKYNAQSIHRKMVKLMPLIWEIISGR